MDWSFLLGAVFGVVTTVLGMAVGYGMAMKGGDKK